MKQLTVKDWLALISRALELGEYITESERAFLRRLYQQGGRTKGPERKRLSRILGHYAATLPAHPRTEGKLACAEGEEWIAPVSETVPEEPVSEAAPSAEPSPVDEQVPAAPIHVLAPLTSHRERDEDYPTLIGLSDVARVINCKDGLQWILQRRYGDQWRGVAFCRRRDTLIREAKRLLGHVSEALLGLPEHHDGPIDEPPRCGVCGRLSGNASSELPRHFFCLADRRASA